MGWVVGGDMGGGRGGGGLKYELQKNELFCCGWYQDACLSLSGGETDEGLGV